MLVTAAFRGKIDTDPCWSPRSFVRASTCYTKLEDGLAQPWSGRTILNPPWSDPGPWIECAIANLSQVTLAAVDVAPFEVQVIVRQDTAPAWAARLREHMSWVAMSPTRERYWKPSKRNTVECCGAPTFCTNVWYAGPHGEHFAATYARAGWTVGQILRHDSIGSTLPPMPNAITQQPENLNTSEGIRDAFRRLSARICAANAERGIEWLRAAIAGGADAAEIDNLSFADMLAAQWELGGARPTVPAIDGEHSDGPIGPKRRKKPSRKAARKPSKNPSGRGRGRPPGAASVERRQDLIRAHVSKSEDPTFTANELCAALQCSRQTLLRALKGMDDVTREGSTKGARYRLVSAP